MNNISLSIVALIVLVVIIQTVARNEVIKLETEQGIEYIFEKDNQRCFVYVEENKAICTND